MNTYNSPVSVGVEVKEKTPKQPTPRPANTAPQMFAVGQTVDLINGENDGPARLGPAVGLSMIRMLSNAEERSRHRVPLVPKPSREASHALCHAFSGPTTGQPPAGVIVSPAKWCSSPSPMAAPASSTCKGSSSPCPKWPPRCSATPWSLGGAGPAESVARRWEVDVERVKRDLDTFLAELLRRGLLVPADQPDRRPPPGDLLAGMVLSALVRLTCGLWRTLKGKAAGLLCWPTCRVAGSAGSGRCACFSACSRSRSESWTARPRKRPARSMRPSGRPWRSRCCPTLASSGAHQLGPGPPRRAGPATGHRAEPLSAARPLLAQLGPMIILGDDLDRCAEYEPVRTYE